MIPLIGKTLNNRYRIEEHIGRGGMAEVYRAYDQLRGVDLALKVMREDLAEDKIFLRRFEREAKTLATLQHPNIVRFFGLERSDGLVYMLMDFIEGQTLRKRISDLDTPMDEAEVVRILVPVCRALNYAHQMGMVHCDVKSANILLKDDGKVFVTDFGIARGMDSATSTMVGIGTPAYMAPELIRGDDPTLQTDIYALGIVLYEMLTGGERPFTGERAEITGTTAEKVRWEHLKLEPIPARQFNPVMNEVLERLIQKCLEKNPVDRYLNIGAFLSDLEKWGSTKPSQRGKSEGLERNEEQKKSLYLNTKNRLPANEVNKNRVDVPQDPMKMDSLKIPWAGIILIGLFLVGAIFWGSNRGGVSREEEQSVNSAEEPPARIAAKAVFIIHGTLGDMSINDSADRGFRRAVEDFGLAYIPVEATSEIAAIDLAFTNALNDPDVNIIAFGSGYLADRLYEIAPEYPEKKFVIFDNPFDFEACPECKDNVYAMQYAQNEGSYLAGYYGCLMSSSKIIGAVGGMDIPVIQDFMIGYVQGAKDAGCQESDVLINYAGSWFDPAMGQELALAMYQTGADVVYQVAGGTGEGVFYAALEAGKWAIGVDFDQATIIETFYPDLAGAIITSMTKNVDNSIYRFFKLYEAGLVPWGSNELLGISEGGVGLAKNKYFEEYTPQWVKDEMDEVIDRVTQGEVQIPSVFR